MEHYIEILSQIDTFCSDFKKDVTSKLEIDSRKFLWMRWGVINFPLYQRYLRTIKGLIQVIEVFGIKHLEMNKNLLLTYVNNLEDVFIIQQRHGFEEEIDRIIEFFSNKDTMKMIRDRLSVLKQEEIERLNEAIHCFLQDCNYSSVIMSVSSIESRLLSLMSSINPDFKSRLEEMTLGALINEYLNNKGKYNNVIPKKHDALLNYCNIYRIFSVHPKKEIINKSVATSILYMAFQFLLDEKLSV